jgi:hypothetical protein
MEYYFEDFTEAEYRNMLKLAKRTWEPIPFGEYRKAGRVCLWRHDLDFSVHRAYRLAQIEAEEGLRATYFIMLHSPFYNTLERDIARLISAIHNLGHDLALHFDPSFYAGQLHAASVLAEKLAFEQQLLSNLFGAEIRAFSLHNPTVGDWLKKIDQEDEIRGMVNAYGPYIRQHYGYCSDSNGYWRVRRLRDVLMAGTDEKLHVLLHDAWWTPVPMSPRARISRAIEGRAAWQQRYYDQVLADSGRENVR